MATVSLFELCTRELVKDNKFREHQQVLPKSCHASIERFVGQFELFKKAYGRLFHSSVEISDVAIGPQGFLDVEETLNRLAVKRSAAEIFDLRMALGQEITPQLWESNKELVERVVEAQRGANWLVYFRIHEYHKRQENEHWNDEVKFNDRRMGMQTSFKYGWNIAGYKLFQETTNPAERASLLFTAWFLCFVGQMSGKVLCAMFETMGDNMAGQLTEEKFQIAYEEYINVWRRGRPPSSQEFQAGLERIPDVVKVRIPIWFEEWATNMYVMIMMQDEWGQPDNNNNNNNNNDNQQGNDEDDSDDEQEGDDGDDTDNEEEGEGDALDEDAVFEAFQNMFHIGEAAQEDNEEVMDEDQRVDPLPNDEQGDNVAEEGPEEEAMDQHEPEAEHQVDAQEDRAEDEPEVEVVDQENLEQPGNDENANEEENQAEQVLQEDEDKHDEGSDEGL
ncbi:hypothetical protein QR680_014828 [Steinernema hermaphroditum]|uniref:Uncharacterized protein n=1 Tax=Steinernema hermaphroditum TaxID=289476 RepID=A0AA39ICF7_9BILA|nr:hypothetical protein QR680_014828 [Steinernema hermaphroditum]